MTSMPCSLWSSWPLHGCSEPSSNHWEMQNRSDTLISQFQCILEWNWCTRSNAWSTEQCDLCLEVWILIKIHRINAIYTALMWENSSYNRINVSRLTMISWNLVCQNTPWVSIRCHPAGARGCQEDTHTKFLEFGRPNHTFWENFWQKAQNQFSNLVFQM